MIIEQIPPAPNLFLLANIVTPDLALRITTHNWLAESVLKKQEGQEAWDRYMVDNHVLITEFESQINDKLYQINEVGDTNYQFAEGTRIWIDTAGFTVPMHLDGTLPSAMQCFWHGEAECGTSFYNSNNEEDVRYIFKAIDNTGYYMRNPDPETNSLWHAMLVPTTKLRITSYTYFR